VVDVGHVVAGKVKLHKRVEPDAITTVPEAPRGSPDSANVALSPCGIDAEPDPFRVIENCETAGLTVTAPPTNEIA
jgi:hypothetical protein